MIVIMLPLLLIKLKRSTEFNARSLKLCQVQKQTVPTWIIVTCMA